MFMHYFIAKTVRKNCRHEAPRSHLHLGFGSLFYFFFISIKSERWWCDFYCCLFVFRLVLSRLPVLWTLCVHTFGTLALGKTTDIANGRPVGFYTKHWKLKYVIESLNASCLFVVCFFYPVCSSCREAADDHGSSSSRQLMCDDGFSDFFHHDFVTSSCFKKAPFSMLYFYCLFF